MQGELADLPLIGVLELMHFSRKTGVLEVGAPIPFALTFVNGEIVDGGVLDWVGLDAIFTLPPAPERGRFVFHGREQGGRPLMPFAHLTTEWGRLADEWQRVCTTIGSPSRVLKGALPGFAEARSVRAVARTSGEPLFVVAQRAAEAVASGKLELTDRYAWHVLRIRHPRARGADTTPAGSLERLMDGQRNLGELVAQGHDAGDLRTFLLGELRGGLRFPGSGWVLRDLAWELEHTVEFELA